MPPVSALAAAVLRQGDSILAALDAEDYEAVASLMKEREPLLDRLRQALDVNTQRPTDLLQQLAEQFRTIAERSEAARSALERQLQQSTQAQRARQQYQTTPAPPARLRATG